METISLNGKWDFMPVYGVLSDTNLPENPTYEECKINVPSIWIWDTMTVRDFKPFHVYDYPEKWNEARTGILRKFIEIKKEEGKRYFLKFNGVAQRWAVYLDGEQIYFSDEMWLPARIEITDRITDKNELCVVCTSFPQKEIYGNKRVNQLAGSWYGKMARGIWESAEIEVVPEKYITDISYDTSVRNNKISVKVETEETCDVTVSVGNLRMQGKTNSFIEAEIDGFELWDIDNPKLYTLTAQTAYDRREIKIGVREIWSEGRDFYLNGKRVNLRGDSWHFQGLKQQTKEYAINWFKVCRENGANYVRLHAEPHPEYYLDAADEVGILIVSETAIYGSGKSMDASDPEYIENCRKHAEGLVLRDKNHPSVVLWSLENEMRWVDGRDVYKTHIGELFSIMKNADPQKRMAFIEGDNRLYPKEKTDVESYHYNIDGTIEQWDRTRPLTYGEHGGWWYICPQNASMFTGLSAYKNVEECSVGLGEKERLFIEYARKHDVSGVSTFNFAHYFATAFPNEDVWIGDMCIRKDSLTVNNGMLKDYPISTPNVSSVPVTAAYREITVIPSEYNTVFYENKTIKRGFDVYNDSRCDAKVRVVFSGAIERTFEFEQKCGVRQELEVQLQTKAPGKYPVRISLFHDGVKKYETEIVYDVYPESYNILTSKEVNFYGSDRDFDIISSMVNAKRIDDLSDIDCDLLILGSNLPLETRESQLAVKLFVCSGGTCIVLEQDALAFGGMSLSRQGFFGVHVNDEHPILEGIGDDELKFWHPYTDEGLPLDIVNNAFIKPTSGDINMVLECSKGDFGDGGDLWTPLIDAGCGAGRIVFNQVEIMENIKECPVALKLLRNMISFGACCEPRSERNVMTINLSDKNEVSAARDFDGTVIILPTTDEVALSELLGTKVSISPVYTYQLEQDEESFVTHGISQVDLYGFAKPQLSPRPVTNYRLAENSISISGGKSLLKSIVNTPFEDYYVNGHSAEFCKMALINMNHEKNDRPLTYVAQYGKFIVSQINVIPQTVRIYDRIRANCGAFVLSNVFDSEPCGRNGAVEYIMTLPLKDNYEQEHKYFTDPVYSLNNLGEGLYGWMKKLESEEDGYLTIPESAGKIHFVTFFATASEDIDSGFDLSVNCDCELFVKGVKAEKSVKFHKGINPVALVLHGGAEDMRFRLAFDANYRLRFSVTVDYVDAK